MYFKDSDLPPEMKIRNKRKIAATIQPSENKIALVADPTLEEAATEEIEYIRTIGVLVQAVRELTEEVDKLKANQMN